MSRRKNGDANRFDAARRALYLEFIRKGYRLCAASEAVGIDRTTVWEYCQRNPDFQKEIDLAEQPSCEQIEDAMFKTALAGNVTAQRLWLYNRSPERWRDRTSVKHEVQITGVTDLDKIQDELLAKVQELPEDDSNKA